MLRTQTTTFRVNPDGTMNIYASSWCIDFSELMLIVKMAYSYAKFKEIKKPVKWCFE